MLTHDAGTFGIIRVKRVRLGMTRGQDWLDCIMLFAP